MIPPDHPGTCRSELTCPIQIVSFCFQNCIDGVMQLSHPEALRRELRGCLKFKLHHTGVQVSTWPSLSSSTYTVPASYRHYKHYIGIRFLHFTFLHSHL